MIDLTILIVDKNLTALEHLADRNVIIEKGVTVWSGSSAALDDQPAIVQRFLGL